jgi:glycosyltransferase involved in cell wall biosynthesis
MPAEGFGGAERQGVIHVANLPRFGDQVTTLVGPSPALQQALNDEGVHDFMSLPSMPEGGAPCSAPQAARRTMAWLSGFRKSVRIVDEHSSGVDLIFANRTAGWLIAAEVATRRKIPYVIRAGSRPARKSSVALLPVWQAVKSSPAAVFSNCRAVEQALAPWFFAPSVRLPNAIDTSSFCARSALLDRRRLGLPSSGRVVGMAARPAPGKGFELLAQIVARLSTDAPDTTFAVAGEYVWRSALESRFAKLGLGSHVRFLGHVQDIRSFYSACDVIVLTSRLQSIEGCPNALLEAMAMERPVVSTDVGGVGEAVVHGVSGFLCPDNDPDAFARWLCVLLEHEVLRSAMGAAGRSRVIAQFNMDDVVARLHLDLRLVLERLIRARSRRAIRL